MSNFITLTKSFPDNDNAYEVFFRTFIITKSGEEFLVVETAQRIIERIEGKMKKNVQNKTTSC